MISVTEALRIVAENTPAFGVVEKTLSETIGMTLAENIYADRDFPPFDRVTMDGIALVPSDATLYRVAGIQFAGQAQQILSEKDTCIEVMTGSMLPQGATAVLRYEDVSFTEENGQKFAHVSVPIHAGQNIHTQGTDRKQGELLMAKGQGIGPAQIAVMASVGKAAVKVHQPPNVAIISTGDELVPVEAFPLPYQIRRSNGYMIQAALKQKTGIEATMHHLNDNEQELTEDLSDILKNHDVLILSGGVSEGKADFIPKVLASLGVVRHFHKVAQRPGKPLWFGTLGHEKVVFALPGNPVSTFMCCYRYVIPALAPAINSEKNVVYLSENVSFKPALTYFLPVKIRTDKTGKRWANPLHGSGSGDFANLLQASGFVVLPAEREEFEKGERVEFLEI